MLKPGELVLLVSPKGKRYLRKLAPDDKLHTQDGLLPMTAVAEAGFGRTAKTHLGRSYRIMKPTLYDLVKGVKRQTQIIYPKEIGYLVMKLGIGPGVTVVEAGCGSGSLTVALAWFVGPQGKVYTHERRPEFLKLNARNLAWAGLDDGRVTHVERDIAEGFGCKDADALFLDVRTPEDYVGRIPEAVKPGAPVGFLVPTTNQVSALIAALEAGPFADIEMLEIFLRRYKPVAERLRPDDRMVAHTGFLVFARVQEPAEDLVDMDSQDSAATSASCAATESETEAESQGEASAQGCTDAAEELEDSRGLG
jgi:tRNA (adenine57-N1/adenine58-N1)-methyltransferase